MRPTVTSMLCALALVSTAARAFDAGPWLEDFDEARAAFAQKYANFEWAIFQREADLAKLFADAREQVAQASSDEEARAAFQRLARSLGDGHVQFRWPRRPRGESSGATEPDRCRALGYDAKMSGRFLASYLPGYRPLPSARSEFPAGVTSLEGRTIGVLRIGLFSPRLVPALCENALEALKVVGPCDDDACSDRVEDWAATQLTRDLDATLVALRKAGAQTLLVDIARNGGGSEWAEAAARMVTAVRLTSERIGFVRGPHWVRKWRALADDMDKAAADAGDDRAMLVSYANEARARARIAAAPCSSEPFWKGARPRCSWLGEGFYATGPLGATPDPEMRSKPWAPLVFTPSKYAFRPGAWDGPLIVLVDGNTASAAEEFAAVLQDNQAAVIIGAPTAGAGCGHTDGGTPTTLSRTGGVLEVPDCARLRLNGENEVAGIQPDVLVGLRDHDGVRQQARLVAAKLAEAERRARSLARP
ncbi:MAG: S41 family peptidase [Bacillota bacterium]